MTKDKFSKILMAFIFINPFLDVINSIVVHFIELKFVPSFFIRAVFLLLSLIYLIVNKKLKPLKPLIHITIIGLIWLFSSLYSYLSFGNIDLLSTVSYVSRACYIIIVFYVFCEFFKNSNLTYGTIRHYLINILAFSAIVLSSTVVFPYLFGANINDNTATALASQNYGFFYSANDAAGALIAIYPFTILCALDLHRTSSIKRIFFIGFSVIMTVCALFLLGTRSTVFTLLTMPILFILYLMYEWIFKKSFLASHRLLKLFLLFFVFLAFYLVTDTITGYKLSSDVSNNIKSAGTSLSNFAGSMIDVLKGKNQTANELFSIYKKSIVTILFGVSRGSVLLTTSLDIIDNLLFFGVFGIIFITGFYLKQIILFFKNYVKKSFRNKLLNYTVLISLLLVLIYSIFVGHIIFTATGGFYLSMILVLTKFLKENKEN